MHIVNIFLGHLETGVMELFLEPLMLPRNPVDRTNQLMNIDISHRSNNESTSGDSEQQSVEELLKRSCDKRSIAQSILAWHYVSLYL